MIGSRALLQFFVEIDGLSTIENGLFNLYCKLMGLRLGGRVVQFPRKIEQEDWSMILLPQVGYKSAGF